MINIAPKHNNGKTDACNARSMLLYLTLRSTLGSIFSIFTL